ncbi:MAG: Zn-ribbon domain-containing OB-fold protein [Actinobacteria bacterium]|nr:Zn-ribbon domain-containing OB-fold protein [Actinomycetota bacterium]
MTSTSPSALGASGGGKPVPVPRGEERAWFDAARDGKLALTRCRACGVRSVVRVVCPACWSTDVETVAARGTGVVYSYTVLHRAGRPGFEADVPYVVALIELPEGPRVMTNVVDCDPADVRIGMLVRLVIDTRDDISFPQFAPERQE